MDRQKEAYNKFHQSAQNVGNWEVTTVYFQSFLVQYKGVEDLEGKANETEQLLMDMEIEDYNNSTDYSDQYLTELGEVDGTQTVTILNNQFTFYFITKSDIFNELKENSMFSFNNRYSVNIFYGIMPDTGAAGVSIVGEPYV